MVARPAVFCQTRAGDWLNAYFENRRQKLVKPTSLRRLDRFCGQTRRQHVPLRGRHKLTFPGHSALFARELFWRRARELKPYFETVCKVIIPPELRRDPDVLRNAQRAVAFHLAMIIWVPVFSGLYYALHAPICAGIVASGGLILIGSLLWLRHGASPAACGNLLSWAAWYVYTALTYFTGGLGAPAMVWYASIPVLSVLLAGYRAGMLCTLSSGLTIAAFALAWKLGVHFPVEVTPVGFHILQVTGLLGLLFCVYILVQVLKNVEFNSREALHQANFRLERLASIDGLTGIANRSSFDRILEEEWRRHERTQLPISVALMDADLFKQYNDAYGHLAGDDCLRSIAQVIQAGIRRPGDVAARYGGEEFALILPGTDEQGAVGIVEAIRLRVRALQIAHARTCPIPNMTISAGIATMIPTRAESPLTLLHEADVALYLAKANGRDQCIHAVTELIRQ